MDDNCGEWVECIGVASGCGEQEAGVASGSVWNLWVWLVVVVVRGYIGFIIIIIIKALCSVIINTKPIDRIIMYSISVQLLWSQQHTGLVSTKSELHNCQQQ